MATRLKLALFLFLLAIPGAVGAQQSVQSLLESGDELYAQLRTEAALARYESAIALDSVAYAVLWRASRAATDLGEAATTASTNRDQLFARAERYARRAVSVDSTDAEGHFALARALGRIALTQGARERVRYAIEVRESALSALSLNPDHAGALHIMGLWNAEVMRLGRVERFFARSLLGGGSFRHASWNEAARYLERAVAIEPDVIVHRLDLARIYLDVGSVERAREQLDSIAELAPKRISDPDLKREAAELSGRSG